MSPHSTESDHQHLKSFMKSVIQHAKIDTGDVRVALMTYSWKPEVIYSLDTFSSHKEVMAGIDLVTSQYKSKYVHTAAALETILARIFTRQEGSRQKAAHLVYFIMNARSNIDQGRVPGVARLLQEAEITVYAVGVESADKHELQSIASNSGSHFVQQVNSYGQLEAVRESLTEKVFACEYVIVDFSSPGRLASYYADSYSLTRALTHVR